MQTSVVMHCNMRCRHPLSARTGLASNRSHYHSISPTVCHAGCFVSSLLIGFQSRLRTSSLLPLCVFMISWKHNVGWKDGKTTHRLLSALCFFAGTSLLSISWRKVQKYKIKQGIYDWHKYEGSIVLFLSKFQPLSNIRFYLDCADSQQQRSGQDNFYFYLTCSECVMRSMEGRSDMLLWSCLTDMTGIFWCDAFLLFPLYSVFLLVWRSLWKYNLVLYLYLYIPTTHFVLPCHSSFSGGRLSREATGCNGICYRQSTNGWCTAPISSVGTTWIGESMLGPVKV